MMFGIYRTKHLYIIGFGAQVVYPGVDSLLAIERTQSSALGNKRIGLSPAGSNHGHAVVDDEFDLITLLKP